MCALLSWKEKYYVNSRQVNVKKKKESKVLMYLEVAEIIFFLVLDILKDNQFVFFLFQNQNILIN